MKTCFINLVMSKSIALFIVCIIMLFTACKRTFPGSASVPIATAQVPTSISVTTSTDPSMLVEQNAEKHEILLIWGMTEEQGGLCSLWIIDPVVQKSIGPLLEQPECNYAAADVNGQQRLITFSQYHPTLQQKPSKITVYEIMRNGELAIKQSILLDEIRLTSIPQWGQDNSVYFSGILNGQEQIFRFDNQTKEISFYIDAIDGFSTNPLISPNGQYLAYEVWGNHKSRDNCIQLTCSLRYYHIWNIETETDVALLSFVEPFLADESFFMHCGAKWSPNGEILAFETGCGLQEPGSIVLFDASSGDVLDVLNAVPNDGSLVIYEWLSDNRLIVSGTGVSLGNRQIYDGYLLFSVESRLWVELNYLPKRNKFDFDQVYFSDWTADGIIAVGSTQVPGKSRIINIVIADALDGNIQYLSIPEQFVDVPLLSPSGSWIGYRAYNWDSQNTQSRFRVLRQNGETVFDTDMMNIVSPKYTWLLNMDEKSP